MNDENIPFSVVPNPFLAQGETLLSDWPEELVQRKSYRPRPIDPEIISTMNVIEKIGYAPKPAHMKKPQIPYILPDDKSDRRKSIESNRHSFERFSCVYAIRQ